MKTLCGTDIVYIPRIKQLMNDADILARFFHPQELTNASAEHLAGIIAAKESFFKALGSIPHFLDIEISYETNGKPKIVLPPEFASTLSCDISISHDQDYAVAFAVITK